MDILFGRRWAVLTVVILGLLALFLLWILPTNRVPSADSRLSSRDQATQDIEVYKIMLWAQNQIDTGVDCRTKKLLLNSAEKSDPGYASLQEKYADCFATGLYYYYFELPFLTEGIGNGNFRISAERFHERLKFYRVRYKNIEEIQQSLGFPHP